MVLPVLAATMTALSIVVWTYREDASIARLMHMTKAQCDGMRGGAQRPVSSRVGIASVIASACATLRSGGSLLQAFSEQSRQGFAVGRLTEPRIRDVLAERALPRETTNQINRVATEIAVAARISDRLGCPAANCLEAVSETYRRSRNMEDLRAQVFAVPKATVRLLSGLPVATILLGELMGSRPVAFLFGAPQGLFCLALGACCYIAGLAWTHALLRGMDLTP